MHTYTHEGEAAAMWIVLVGVMPLSHQTSGPPAASAARVRFTRRAALLPLLAAPTAATAFEFAKLPEGLGILSGPPDAKRALEQPPKEDRAALQRRVRAERMAAEARAQNEEYVNRMNTYKFGTGTFGSTVSVGGERDAASEYGDVASR